MVGIELSKQNKGGTATRLPTLLTSYLPSFGLHVILVVLMGVIGFAISLLDQHPLRAHLDYLCLEIDLLIMLRSGDDPGRCVEQMAKRRAELHKESDTARSFQEQFLMVEKHRWQEFVSWMRYWREHVSVASKASRLPRN